MSSDEPARIERKLERERRARLESERIAERTTRELYETVQALRASEAEVRDAAAIVALLQQVAVAANEAASLPAAAEIALAAVCEHASWPVGHLYVAVDGDRLEPTTVWHVDDPNRCAQFMQVTEATSLVIGEGLPGRTLESGRPHWIEDLYADPNFPRARAAERIEVQSGFAVPVLVGTEVVAVLEFYAYDSIQPSAAFLDVMANVGAQLGRVVERERLEARLERQAMYDHLTGLPNRMVLVDRINHSLARRRRGAIGPAVLFIDLDGFKPINDSFGHAVGDRLLCVVAERVTAVLRPSDTLARQAGDEFVVVLDQVEDPRDAAVVAERITEVLARPVELDGESIHVTASIGVALAEEDATSEALLADADAAMYTAKRAGRGRFEVFGEGMRSRASTQLRLENQLRDAISTPGELELFYQPLMRLGANRPGGVEALLRWNHPERGLLLPADFIKLAEDTGLIVPIGAWVFGEACRQANLWHELLGLEDFEVAVNLSARQIVQADFVATIAGALETASVDAGQMQLCLEITETVLMGDPDTSAGVLKDLRSLGFRLAIDDFGTGYSSLAYLRTFPVDIVKLDRTFITDVDRALTDRTIVGAVIELAHALDLSVVAEGVETNGQLEVLEELGCDLAQGYLFSRPAPVDTVTSLLRKLTCGPSD